ncbi:MAG: ABC transporter ATP-binding protein, partial [Planctomycetota bacterium]
MTIVPMPFIAWGSIYFQNRLAPLYQKIREQVGVINGHLANNLGGIATIKSFTAESSELESVRLESREYVDRNRQAIRISSAFVPMIRMIIVTGFIAILYFGGRMTLDGQLEVWQYSVMIFMTQRLLWPLTSLGSTLDLYQRATASIQRVFDLLQTPSRIVTGAKELPRHIQGQVAFDSVTFAYESAKSTPVLSDLSLQMDAGKTTAIVGATGSGKSSLVKLLLRFYDVDKGTITVDDIDVRDARLDQLRKSIGLVSQDVFLFHGSVIENIRYGKPDASRAEIEAAAEAAEAHDFIMQLPNGYETIVGERGQKLSGGQRQRISIARAILKDPPILVLDEGTSAVDNETEAAIQRSLQRIAVGRTTIVIAHRLSTIRHAHQIYVLENGRLVEQGSHDSLVTAGGIYWRLWNVQTGESISS